MHSRFARAVCSIQLYRLISVASFIFGHRSIIVSQYFNISSGNRRKHTVTMKNQQSLRFNNSYLTCFRNYTNRIRGIRPFKHPSPRIEFIKRASLFALILAASSFDNRVAREAAIQRRERRRFPTVFNPCTRVYVYVYTHAWKKRNVHEVCVSVAQRHFTRNFLHSKRTVSPPRRRWIQSSGVEITNATTACPLSLRSSTTSSRHSQPRHGRKLNLGGEHPALQLQITKVFSSSPPPPPLLFVRSL